MSKAKDRCRWGAQMRSRHKRAPDVTRLGEVDRDPGQPFGVFGEQLLGRDRLLVANAARRTRRIAALAFLELHGVSFRSVRLDGVASRIRRLNASARAAPGGEFQTVDFSYTFWSGRQNAACQES